MNEMSLDVFLHGSGRPQVVNTRLGETLRELLVRCDALPGEGQFVFIGEVDEAIRLPDADADTHEPVDLELTIEQLELHKHKHVHTQSVHRVEVTVFFNGHHKRRFSPATTIATVTTWAKKRFNIDPSAGADFVLALRPTGQHPRPNEYLGELLEPGCHALEFDLVKEVTPQG
ncbi:hypothetical protein P3T23_006540 [Paraburkholderia sp. GAS448]|uniref:hypothetical protein n=1 Tax=Paraburkholderia sp. GAS448 TaxID=3035136 RepID=UPI003D2296C2